MEDVFTTRLTINLPPELHKKLWDLKNEMRARGKKLTIESLAVAAITHAYGESASASVMINGVEASAASLIALSGTMLRERSSHSSTPLKMI